MQNAHIKNDYDADKKSDDTPHRWLHPMSGLIILGLDWLLFGGSVISAGTGTLPLSLAGFVVGLLAVLGIQRNWGGDTINASLLKGLLAGIAVGIPFPVFGTLLGGVILTISGLDRFIRKK